MTFDSNITPDMWTGIPLEEKRTNNGTESFHSHFKLEIGFRFKVQFYTSHPSIFILNELYLAVTTFKYLNYP